MADSSDIDQALIAKLSSDAALLALMPNGVYWDQAPPKSSQFVIVSFIDHEDGRSFDGRAFEDGLYLVKAVELSTVATKNVKAAAARIDELLENQTLSAAGYEFMTMFREQRIRTTAIDDLDNTIRWFHRGGYYRIQMSTQP